MGLGFKVGVTLRSKLVTYEKIWSQKYSFFSRVYGFISHSSSERALIPGIDPSNIVVGPTIGSVCT